MIGHIVIVMGHFLLSFIGAMCLGACIDSLTRQRPNHATVLLIVGVLLVSMGV